MAYCNLYGPVKADEIKRRGKVEISIRKSLAWGHGMPLPLIGSSHISKIRARNIVNLQFDPGNEGTLFFWRNEKTLRLEEDPALPRSHPHLIVPILAF